MRAGRRLRLGQMVVALLLIATTVGVAGPVEAAPSDLDPSFDGDGKVVTPGHYQGWDVPSDVARQADGKLVVAGSSSAGANRGAVVVRYHPDGQLDTSFGGDGKASVGDGTSASSIAVLPDGRIVVAGTRSWYEGAWGDQTLRSAIWLSRLLPDGQLDPSFGSEGFAVGADGSSASAMAVLADGRIVVAGSSDPRPYDGSDFLVGRFLSDGRPDLGFGVGGSAVHDFGRDEGFAAITTQPDGRIVAAGLSGIGDGSNREDDDFAIVRYNHDGSLDPGFDGDGVVTTAMSPAPGRDGISGVVVQRDGRIVVAGSAGQVVGDESSVALARYLPDGRLDPSFGSDGTVTTPVTSGDDNVSGVALQADGRIVVVGSTYCRGAGSCEDYVRHLLVGRYDRAGALDAGFGDGGFIVMRLSPGDPSAGGILASGALIQPDGRIVVVGVHYSPDTVDVETNSSADFSLMRFLGDTPPSGYWMIGSDGAVYAFGAARHEGNPPSGGVDVEPALYGEGYWTVDAAGVVSAFGVAGHHGNAEPGRLEAGESVTSLSATPTGAGYWLFTTRGRVLPFGDAAFFGDLVGTRLNGPVLDSVATPSGRGYYMVASDGGIFSFGDATFRGSMGGKRLNAPVQSLAPDSDGIGYWLVASDGGIFAFDAAFRGSMGDTPLNKPIVGMVRNGNGYLMVGEDGGIFNFSDQPFHGSLGNQPPGYPIVSVAALTQ